jgi:hypothetical protein
MNRLFIAAREVQSFCRKKKWRHCIIGGLAVIRWGEPRVTKDVDISLLTGLGGEAKYVDCLLEHFPARIPDARPFALEKRVVLCSATNGVPLDIALGWVPFEEQVIARASSFRFAPRFSLVTASAEDLLVLKTVADRERDWVDIRGIIIRQSDRLDWTYIRRELATLSELKEDEGMVERLEALRRQVAEGRPPRKGQ